MDQKRAMTGVDLAALVTELRGYAGATVDKAYRYGEDLVRIKMRDVDRGRLELLIAVGDPMRAHLAAPEHVPDAPERPPDFAMKLRNRIAGADLRSVSQYEFDRIVVFEFDRQDAATTVVAELFGDGNVAVLDPDRKVVASLDTVRLKSRTVAPGAQYEFPASRYDPTTADYEAFATGMAESDSDLVRTLATQLNFGGQWAEELCTRAGVEKTLAIAEAGETEYEALYEVVERLADQLRRAEFDPQVYRERANDDQSDGTDSGRPVDVAPVPLAERADHPSESYETFNEALDGYFTELGAADSATGSGAGGGAGAGGAAGRGRPDFEAQIDKRERIVTQQEGAIEEFEQREASEREKAELLYANYELVDEVLSTVRDAREDGLTWGEIADRFEEGADREIDAAKAVVDVDTDGTVTLALGDHRVALDPSMGVEKNADRLYTEAKRIDEKREGAEEALADTRRELADLERRREEWEAGESEETAGTGGATEAGTDDGSQADWLTRSSIPVRHEEQWYERFRWFHTSEGFLVIGGRNADQNEELVKKYLSRGDRFFHAQAHGGPATILKATGPSEPARDIDIPEASRREAAQFAVSYSSIWKEGKYAGDAYEVGRDQVSKTPESGEYLEKGGFAVRGERTYYEDTPVGVAVGIQCAPETRVLGGPPSAVEGRVATNIAIEPGRYAQNDIATMLYREFRERFADEAFVRKVASADRIQEFCPPGGSRIVEE